MTHWNHTVGDQASALASFLHRPWSRERFVVTCLTGELERHRPAFATFPADLSRWRWGDVQTVVRRLVELEVPLRSAWDPARLSFKDGGAVAEVSTCTDAVRSDFFWSYLRMVSMPGP